VLFDSCLLFFFDFIFIFSTGWLVVFALVIHLLGVGFLGILLNQNHLITLLMFMELVLMTVAFGFTLVSVMFGGQGGFILMFLLLVVAGVESALALSLVTGYFFVENRVYIDQICKLKG